MASALLAVAVMTTASKRSSCRGRRRGTTTRQARELAARIGEVKAKRKRKRDEQIHSRRVRSASSSLSYPMSSAAAIPLWDHAVASKWYGFRSHRILLNAATIR